MQNKTRSLRKLQRGFSLTEALLTSFLLAVGMVAVAKFQGEILQSNAETKARTEAVHLAQERVEQVRTAAAQQLLVAQADTVCSLGCNNVNLTDTPEQQAGSNTSFERVTAVIPIIEPAYSLVSATVNWASIKGEEESAQLNSIVSNTNPIDSGQILLIPCYLDNCGDSDGGSDSDGGDDSDGDSDEDSEDDSDGGDSDGDDPDGDDSGGDSDDDGDDSVDDSDDHHCIADDSDDDGDSGIDTNGNGDSDDSDDDDGDSGIDTNGNGDSDDSDDDDGDSGIDSNGNGDSDDSDDDEDDSGGNDSGGDDSGGDDSGGDAGCVVPEEDDGDSGGDSGDGDSGETDDGDSGEDSGGNPDDDDTDDVDGDDSDDFGYTLSISGSIILHGNINTNNLSISVSATGNYPSSCVSSFSSYLCDIGPIAATHDWTGNVSVATNKTYCSSNPGNPMGYVGIIGNQSQSYNIGQNETKCP